MGCGARRSRSWRSLVSGRSRSPGRPARSREPSSTRQRKHRSLARKVSAVSPSQVAHVTTDASGRFTFPLAVARDVHDFRATRRIRRRLDLGHLGLCRSKPSGSDRAAEEPQTDRTGDVAIVAQPGATGHGHRRLFGQPRLDDRGCNAGRWRRPEQRIFGDRVDAGCVRTAESGRRKSNRLHSRRLLRPDRLRVRRRADQPIVRQLSRKLRDDARPARAANLHRRRRGRRQCDRSRADSSIR